VKELPPSPPNGASSKRERERDFIHRDPFIHLSKSLIGEPSSRFPKWGPYGRRCPSPEPFLNPDILFLFQKSRQTNPLQVSQQGPYEERPVYRAFCISLKNLIFRVPQ
jgi:hypothetical protein